MYCWSQLKVSFKNKYLPAYFSGGNNISLIPLHLLTLLLLLQELGLLLVLVAVAILTYSSLVYFAEKEGKDAIRVLLVEENIKSLGKGSKKITEESVTTFHLGLPPPASPSVTKVR